MLYEALTSQDVRELKARSKAQGWQPLNVKGAYNRAYVRFVNGVWQLKSYDTIVFEYHPETGELVRTWDGYSATTMKHVQMFVSWCNHTGYSRNQRFIKKAWNAMEVCDPTR